MIETDEIELSGNIERPKQATTKEYVDKEIDKIKTKVVVVKDTKYVPVEVPTFYPRDPYTSESRRSITRYNINQKESDSYNTSDWSVAKHKYHGV